MIIIIVLIFIILKIIISYYIFLIKIINTLKIYLIFFKKLKYWLKEIFLSKVGKKRKLYFQIKNF